MLLMGRNRSELILSRALSRRYLGNAIGLPMPEEGTMSAVPAEVLALFGYLRETSAAADLLVFWTAFERPGHGLAAGGPPAANVASSWRQRSAGRTFPFSSWRAT